MQQRTWILGLIAAMAAAGCGDDSEHGPDIAPECNPLGGDRCVLPFPSSLYLADDPDSPTGVRVDIPAGALPQNEDGVAIDPAQFNSHDGFSPAAPILAAFAVGVDPANLPSWTDFDASLAADSPTLLVDMETGELVPHFAELDARADFPEEQALYIRPAVLLAGGRRYAVAIKRTLKAQGGGELPRPAGFQSILDGTTSEHERLERIRPGYPDIFAALADHGVAPDDLVVAWDFVTASRESMRRDLLAARDSALAMLADSMEDLEIEITRDEPSGDERFARDIEGFFEAPLFLSDGGEASVDSRMLRGPDGTPQADGFYKVPFDAMIPKCALEAEAPVPMLVYGHGLLGDSDQVMSGGTRIAASELCMVAIGTDLRGMSSVDVPNVIRTLADLNRGPLIFDTLIQGVVNHIALVQVARGRLAGELFVDDADQTLVDPDTVHYYGISQGGIFGGTIAAYDPVIEKAVLQVGAMNYSMMLERSLDWPTYALVLEGAYQNPLDVTLLLSLMQMQWDRTDPVAVADAMLTGGIPGVPQKQVLMQIAVADVEVSNLASEYQVRSMGIPVLTPSVKEPWGIEAAAGPLENALVIYDFGLGDTIPVSNQPPPDNEVHSQVRKHEATVEMMRRFYRTGEIVQMCGDAGCDCDAGGCGAEL